MISEIVKRRDGNYRNQRRYQFSSIQLDYFYFQERLERVKFVNQNYCFHAFEETFVYSVFLYV